VNKRWRDYKSDLKKQYFNPDKRSFDQIEKDVPDGVNENQWSFLLGIWCSEAHQVRIATYNIFSISSVNKYFYLH
jgi:hypothetical protein